MCQVKEIYNLLNGQCPLRSHVPPSAWSELMRLFQTSQLRILMGEIIFILETYLVLTPL